MKALVIGAFALALAFVGQQVMAADQWRTVSAPEDGFVVQMPGQPSKASQPTELAGMQGTVTRYEITGDGTYWGVSATSYGTPFSKPVNTTLDQARDRALNAGKGQIHEDRAITLGAIPGRELVYYMQNAHTNNQRMVVRQRIYLAGKNKLVQLAYIGAPGTERSEAVNYYFNSLKLNP